MREGSTAILVRREDYAAPAFWIRSVDLTFDLDAAKTMVASKLRIERNPAHSAQPLRLHGEGLNLLRVQINGESVSFRHENDELVIDNPPADNEFLLELRNTCAPEKNTALSGLYQSGSGLFTQCEAEGFRRITFFLDRPDVMATFRVLMRASKALYPTLLSNGNLVESGELDNGRHWAQWEDPFPKPSYLFALVAANLACREQRIRSRAGKEHLLQIYVKREDLGATEHAMNSLIASVAWDEARFGLSLDLDRFMIVAVEDFNMGAMENKGLNIFNTKYVLASPATATDADFNGVESVVAHEYFHNWTGNRITCRDWFQLSLKEGLTVFRDQEFSADMAHEPTARAVSRIGDVRALRAVQFPEDAGGMSHPVRPDVYEEINNFYTSTIYEKGAEVVRMMHTLVGREGFAAGMALYFKRHDGQAVTCDDFAQAIADANPGSALSTRLAAFKRWYAQAGTPVVKARWQFDASSGALDLTLSQHLRPGQAAFVIPVQVALVHPGHGGSSHERLLVLEEFEQTFRFEHASAAMVPSLLRGFSAPVRLEDGLDEAGLLTLLRHDSDAFNRWEASQRLALNRLLAGVEAGAPRPLDAAFIDAMRHVLRTPELAPALKELALTLPSEGYLAEQLESVDPALIHRVRHTLLQDLAAALEDDFAWAHGHYQVRGGYQPTPEQAGQRAMVNLSLSMLCLNAQRSGDTVWPGRAYQRVKDASNMTERLGALRALVHSHAELATPALAHFHHMFQGDALVLDQWFDLQASAPDPLDAPGTVFNRVKVLLQHPDFSMKNPNRARSVLMSLCMRNPAAFHRADAAGYVLWAERVLQLDATNPQLAARLARAMDRNPQWVEPYRSAAREALNRVAAKPDLSPDVREIVSRAIG
jgi:aminopeptidase N